MNAARSALWPAAAVAAVVLIWQLAVWYLALPSHLLPSPVNVGRRLSGGLMGGDMWPDIGATVAGALAGYTIGAVAALVLAAVLVELPILDRALQPYILAFQAIPKVAIAPLIFIWVGFGLESQVILVVLIVFFPLFLNSYLGLSGVDRNLLDLYKVFSAGRLHTFVNLRLPAASPQIFIGLQIAVAFSLTGCVVMEFLTGTRGAGFLIVNASNSLDAETAVAAMVVLGAIGVLGTQLVRIIERRVVFWHCNPNEAAAVAVSS